MMRILKHCMPRQLHLSSLFPPSWRAAGVALWPLIRYDSRHLPVATGSPAGLLLGRLARRAVRVLQKQNDALDDYKVPSPRRWMQQWKVSTLTASLELEVDDVKEGDSGEGDECRDGDGEDELDDVLLLGADGKTTTSSSSSSSSSTLLLHSSSCWDSNRDTSFPAGERRGIT